MTSSRAVRHGAATRVATVPPDRLGLALDQPRAPHHAAPWRQAIADLAESEKTDLIVMGTHGHSALGNLVLGSVATGVLARTEVPVLLIR